MSAALSSMERAGLAAWETKRNRFNLWTKNETCRWLDTLTLGVLGYLKARRMELPRKPTHGEPHVGQFLKDRFPAVFAAVHTALAGADRDQRKNLTLGDVLP